MPSRTATVSAFALLAAAIAAPAATAGLVGSSVEFRWIRNGTLVDAKTFVVSSLMPEYYYSTPFVGSAWGAMGLDVRNTSMTFTADFADTFNVFLPLGTVLELAVPATVRLESLNLGSMSGVTGLDQGDLSIDGNVLRISAGGIQFDAPGSTFTLSFESTLLPGPSAIATLAAMIAMPRRRRG